MLTALIVVYFQKEIHQHQSANLSFFFWLHITCHFSTIYLLVEVKKSP